MGQLECAYGVWTHQRNAQREHRAMRGDGKKRAGLCAGIGVAPVQGRPRGKTGEGTAVDVVDGW